MTNAENRIASMLYPLTDFYQSDGQTAPTVDVIDGEKMPQPYRSLLVHRNDMTPTLEAYCADTIHLQVLQARFTPEAMNRKVLLILDGLGTPIEFGAIRIELSRFDPEVRKIILEGYCPLGTILRRHEIPHRSDPNAFFSVQPDDMIREAFRLQGSELLYGRHNVITNDRGQSLAEVVEILPPIPASVQGGGTMDRDKKEMAGHGR